MSEVVRAVIYGRISNDREGRELGVARQVEDATALAERMGWAVIGEPYIDNDIGASTKSKPKRRPAYEAILDGIEKGEIDAIAYYSSSRLTRRPKEFERIIELVEKTGCRLASVASGIADLTTADGRMIARILAAQDAAESERISERVLRSNQQRVSMGLPSPSSRSFGFEKGGEVVVPEEAELIQEAALRIADEGWSLGEVMRDWNQRQIPTLRGAGKWNRTQVSRALTSDRAAGLIVYKGKTVGTRDSILTPELRDRVKRQLTDRRRGTATTSRGRKNYLAGFLVCGKCGKPMKVNALLGEDGSLRRDSYAVCSRSQYGCGNVKRNLPLLLEYLEGLILMRLESWQPVDSGEMEVQSAIDVEVLEAELRVIKEDLEDLQSAFDAGSLRFRDYHTSLNTLRTREDSISATLAALLVPKSTPDDLDVLRAFTEGDVKAKREVLGILVDHIKLMPVGRVGPAKVRELMPDTTVVVWR